ncbi:MAG: helix-turn-helix domain-containing protein [Gammaproteobacteria bacterium]|nr:helix-turn-helix domain-containing protein [Gammaproteobacteria bacterium]
MDNHTFLIGQLAKRGHCKVATVHYYEKTGLMPKPPRSAGGHRIYALEHLKRLSFIRRSRDLGFSIAQTRELLTLLDEPDHVCGEVKTMAQIHADKIQEKINDLQRFKTALDQMVQQCKNNDASTDDCPIIDALYVVA